MPRAQVSSLLALLCPGSGCLLLSCVPPPVPISGRRHCCHSCEPQSEEAACCPCTAVLLRGCPTRHTCPCDPSSPLGFAGGGDSRRPGFNRPLACGHVTAVCRGPAGFPPPPCAGPLAGCPPALSPSPAPPPPPPRGGAASCNAAVVIVSSSPRARSPVGVRGVADAGASPSVRGKKAGGETMLPSAATGLWGRLPLGGGGGAYSSGCDPPSAFLDALWRFCRRRSSFSGDCSVVHFRLRPVDVPWSCQRRRRRLCTRGACLARLL